MKKYKLTKEHEAQLAACRDEWIANAMSTKSMDEDERNKCRDAVKRLYEAANLKPPPDNRIVFVPSPFVLRFAGGFAAAIWQLRKNKDAAATDDATSAATDDATDAATRDATYAATAAATLAATDAATLAATYAATAAATLAATAAATAAATRAATYAATAAATAAATRDAWYSVNTKRMAELSAALNIGEFGLKCAQNTYRMWQGGNQGSAWCCFLGFFKDIVKLDIDYSKYTAWETLVKHSGPRIMHPEFCMISDRPEILLVDNQNRTHCDTGPFCKWRDGSAIYSINGVRMPMWVCETPKDDLDSEKVMAIENVEQRLMAIKKIGIGRVLSKLKSRVISEGELPNGKGTHGDGIYRLHEVIIEGSKEKLFEMPNPSEDKRHFEFVVTECNDIFQADMWRRGLDFTKKYEPTGLRA